MHPLYRVWTLEVPTSCSDIKLLHFAIVTTRKTLNSKTFKFCEDVYSYDNFHIGQCENFLTIGANECE